MKKVWKGFAAAVSAAAIAATGFIGATSASAADNGTIKITNTVAGDAFAAYKLLDVTFATTGEGATATTSYSYKLIAGTDGFSNQTKALVAAANATLDTDTDIDLATYTYSDANSVNALQKALIEKIDSFKTNAANVRKYSEELYKQVKTGGANPVTATNTATATGANTEISVPQGYYLAVQTAQGKTEITDVEGNVTGTTTLNTQSAYIIDTVLSGKVTELELKAESVTFDKKLQDINDSESTTKGPWQDGADYDLNDIVPFKLDATLPANYTNYHYFEMKFNDTLSPGLTYQKDAKVYVVTKNAQNKEVENEITAGFTTTTTPTSTDTDTEVTPDTANGTSIVVSTADLKATTVTVANDAPITNGSLIRVKYTAKVNNNAIIGANGNPNTANLQFTANPNVDSDGGLNQTPDDVVKVFTYQYNVDKTFAGPTAPTTMPKFTLSKFYAEPAPAEGVEDKRIEIDGVKGNWKTVSEVEVKNVAEAGKDPQYVAAFPRIDDGKYKVEETVVPDGWNKADDVFFEITAVHTETDDSQSLTELKITYYTDGTFANVKTDVAGTTNGVADGNVTTGIVSTGIENTQGSELPSTGGMGTTVLYVAGAAIVLIAGIGLAVAFRRRQA